MVPKNQDQETSSFSAFLLTSKIFFSLVMYFALIPSIMILALSVKRDLPMTPLVIVSIAISARLIPD